MPWSARSVAASALFLVVAGTAGAQNMRTQIRNVFHFGDCEQLICLSTASGAHGSHYNPDAAGVGLTLIEFLSSNIATSVGNVPLGATSSGMTFRFDASGQPIATAQSTGPIVGERSQTLGKGRAVIGAHATRSSPRALRGVPLGGLEMTLTHQDTDPAGLGDPSFERDTLHVATSLEGTVDVLSIFATYGLTSNIDIGIAIPVVRLDFEGRSIGEIFPTSGSIIHYFGGSPGSEQLVDTASSSGSATGIGDISVRVKFNLAQGSRGGAAFLTDVRVPTGDREDLLGAGKATVGGTFILAATFDRFTPHLNAGYLYRAGEDRNKAFSGALGFDALVAPQVTLASDLIGQWEVAESRLVLPPPVVYLDGTVVRRTNIPTMHDDLLAAAFGAKWSAGGGMIVVGNVILPLAEGGLRSDAVWTFGLQRPF